MTEENNNGMNIQFNLNEFMTTYNRADFMRDVFVKFLKQNPKILTDSVADYVLTDIIRSADYEGIKDSVKKEVISRVEKFTSNTQQFGNVLTSEIDKVVREQVQASKGTVLQQIKSSISSKNIKSKISKQVADVVEQKVLSSLGEVCDGCGNDYEY